jgi:hypothetical protein
MLAYELIIFLVILAFVGMTGGDQLTIRLHRISTKKMRFQSMFNIRLSGLLITFTLFVTSTANAELWSMSERSFGAAIAYESKTTDPKFEGTKLFIDGRYFFNSKQGEVSERRKCCALPAKPEYFYGMLEGQLRFSFEGEGLEYVMLDFTPLAGLYEPTVESPNSLRATADALKLGAVRFISDDPLEVDYYLELSFFRAGRNGIYQWNRESPQAITGGVQLLTGWSWAETKVQDYSEVSNPFVGIVFNLAWEHDRWGSIYTNNRFVNGFSFSNPSRGHPMVREAGVTFGYLKQITGNLALDIIFEKKSFYFDEGGLPGLYTMSRSVAADFTYRW